MSPHTFTLADNVVLVLYVMPRHEKIVVVVSDVVVDVLVVVMSDVVVVTVVVDDVLVVVEVVDVDVVVVTVVVDDVLDTLVGSVGIIVVVELLVIETTLNIAVRVLLPVIFIVVFCVNSENKVILFGDGVAFHPENEYPEGVTAYML
jgi:hypothetical protein